MPFEFTPIKIAHQAEYLRHFESCPQKSSDYSFANLWGWADEYGLQWAWQDGLVWLRQTAPKPHYWAPIGAWSDIAWDEVFDRHQLTGARFSRVPEKLVDTWRSYLGRRMAVAEDRDNWDYLYAVNELVELKGNRFHKKKNLVKQFMRNNDFHYTRFDEDMIEQAMAMQADWCHWKDCESSEVLAAENRAVFKIFMEWEQMQGLLGGALHADGVMIAYTVGEMLSDDTVVVHYEKGCPEYKGVYQAINQMFLAHLPPGPTIVNREQDLGEEGLRKAKLSYNPVGFLKKYKVTITG